jgi:pimeloyl-ACP methyl ester carboxylesterase
MPVPYKPGRLRRRLGRFIRGIIGFSFLVVVAALIGFRLSALLREQAADTELAPPQGRLVVTDAGDLFVQEAGPADGPAVLLVPGTGVWSEVWRPTLTALADAGYHALAVDLPPFGFSPRETWAAYRTPDQALRLTELVQALGLDSVVLVGHSVGAKPTVVAAWQMPDRLRGLVLVDATLDPVRPEPLRSSTTRAWTTRVLEVPLLGEALVAATITNPMLSRWLVEQLVADSAIATPDRVEMFLRPMARRGTTASITSWLRQALIDHPRTGLADRQRYARVDRPVLLIWGAEDRITPLEQGRRLEAAFGDASATVLPGAGHLPQVEQPDQFNAALLAWLNDLHSTSAGVSDRASR